MADTFGRRVNFKRTLEIPCSKCRKVYHREFDGNMGVQKIAEALRKEGFTIGMDPICPACKNKKRELPYYLKKN